MAGRLFGFSSWSMLVPQALEGVAAVGLLAATVRRVSGHVAGLVAGLALALTPVAALMFRFNNPDAMLTVLLVGAGYALVRALERASVRWLALAGALVGLGFITKMGQALLVVPALGLAYLVAAPTRLGRRIVHLLVAGAAMVVGAGWWIAAVQLWPASSRPYIGGSTNNSILNLAFGYNGLGRLFGSGSGSSAVGGSGNGSFGGATGPLRLLRSDMATEISWLLPTAVLALAVGLWRLRARPRTDRTRAALVMFGTWLAVTAAVFSYMQGIIHPYYTVALAPAIAAVVAITARLLWQERAARSARAWLTALVAVTAGWDAHLLSATPTFAPALPYLLLAAALVSVVGLLSGARLRAGAVVALAATVVAGLGGSTAYALATASQPHSGSIPSSGPVASGIGGAGSTGGVRPPGGQGPTGGQAPRTSAGTTGPPTASGSASGAAGSGSPSGRTSATSAALVTALQATTSRWAAATVGSQSAAALQLASGRAIMSIGGFNGADPSPTLAQFEQDVAAGQIHYFVAAGAAGAAGSPGGSGTGTQISAWVASHFTASTVGGVTVYDLTRTATT
jgi:4-amino-4-deoxy-L-arabinose transferase-like glycosyltransferase